MKSKKPDDCTILQYRTKQHLLELGWGKRVYVDQIILTSIHTGKEHRRYHTQIIFNVLGVKLNDSIFSCLSHKNKQKVASLQ